MFALASVTALGGLVAAVSAAGCTTTEVVQQTTDGGATDGGKRDARQPPTGDDEEPEEETCKTKGAKFEPDEYKAPRAPNATACSDEVLNALTDACFQAAGGKDCADAREVPANKACADCIFSAKSDPEWGAIVLNEEGATPPAFYNQAGCLDNVTGMPQCGKGVLDVIGCFDHYCGKCPSESAEEEACLEEVGDPEFSGECTDYLVPGDCFDAVLAKQDKCFPGAKTEAAYKQFFRNIASVFCAAQPPGGDPDGG